MMIGGLFARLSLNSAQFEQGVKRARSTMFRLAKDMAVMSTAAAAGGAALGAMGAAAVQSAREVQRLSQVAGASPRELQRWSAATRTVGIDQEKLADILKDVNDRVGDFVSTGGGPMADFFTNIAPKVGVTAQEFAKLSGPEALQLYVDSLQKAGLNQKEMTFYMEAMASDSTMLLPLLKNNASELNRLGDAAEKAGGNMSDMDVANLARAGQAFDSLRHSAIGMRNVLAAKLAPTLEKVAGAMQKAMEEGGALRRIFDFLGENAGRIAAYVGAAGAAFGAYSSAVIVATAVTQGFKRALIRTGIGALVVGLGEAVYQFMRLKAATGDAGRAMDMFKNLAKGAVNYAVEAFFWFGNRLIGVGKGAVAAFKEVFADISSIVKSVFIEAINGALRITESGLNKIITKIRSIQFDINSRIAAAGGGKDQMIGYMQLLDLGELENPYAKRANAAGKRAADAFMKGFNTDTGRAPKVFDAPDVVAQWKKIQETVSGVRKEAVSTTDTFANLDTAFSGTGQAAQTAASKTDELTDAVKKSQEQVGQLGSMFASTFASIITKSSSAKEAVSGLLNRFAEMAANNAFMGLWNGTIGASVASGGSSWLGAAAGFLFGGVGANANGTPSWQGGMTWVGERGPELVNLPRGSAVYDAQRSKGMAHGGASGRVVIQLADGLKAEWLGEAGNQSVQIVQSGLDQYDRQMPARFHQIAADPRGRR